MKNQVKGAFGNRTKKTILTEKNEIQESKLINFDQIEINHTINPFGVGLIDINKSKIAVRDFLKMDKIDGITHTHYLWHRGIEAISAMDTKKELDECISVMTKQGLKYKKSITISEGQCKDMGVKSAIIYVYYTGDTTINLYGRDKDRIVVDNVSLAFGYSPAGNEDCYTEVYF